MPGSRRVRSRRVRSRNARRTGGARSRKATGANRVTFAAKLAAFLLQGASNNIEFSLKNGFSNRVPEVFGVLPYLHMNIKENEFRNLLNNSSENRRQTLTNLCNKNHLEKHLNQVGFSCVQQPRAGVKALDKAIVDSINNRWSIRQNGQRNLRTVLKHMRTQVDKGIIPSRSVSWGNGL